MHAPPTTATPTFRRLDRRECEAVLARNDVGRMAFTFHDRVDIEPLHFVFDGEWLFARTAMGTKVSVLAHHPWVALEVDEIHGPFDWVSVIVHGAVFVLRQRGTPTDRARYERALVALRRAFPNTLLPDDPVGFRQIVIGVHVDEITGRGASTSARA